MAGGFMGRMLFVDLSNRSIETEEYDDVDVFHDGLLCFMMDYLKDMLIKHFCRASILSSLTGAPAPMVPMLR